MPLKLVKAQRDGTHFTASEIIPLNHDGPVTVTLDIDPVDLIDPTLSCKFSVFVLVPGDKWQHLYSGNWEGAADNDPDALPSISFNSLSVRGKVMRVEISVPKRMKVGVDAVW